MGRKNHEARWPEAPVGASLHQANLSQLLTESFSLISWIIRLQFNVLVVAEDEWWVVERLTEAWSPWWSSIRTRSSVERTLVVELARTIVSFWSFLQGVLGGHSSLHLIYAHNLSRGVGRGVVVRRASIGRSFISFHSKPQAYSSLSSTRDHERQD